jgi:hypothetical protein
MPKVLSMREENAEEKRVREWFSAQALESPKNLEEAARLLIGLVTGLLGALFAVLTVSAETLPAYMSLPLVRTGGVEAVALWLVSLLAGLMVVLPRKWQVDAGKPNAQNQALAKMLEHKSRWLAVSVVSFGLAIVALAVVLIAALLSI